jgi:hypothetical protein
VLREVVELAGLAGGNPRGHLGTSEEYRPRASGWLLLRTAIMPLLASATETQDSLGVL